MSEQLNRQLIDKIDYNSCVKRYEKTGDLAIFPQKFESFFNSKYINIHHPEFMIWWQKNSHRASAKAFNKQWDEFIRASLNGGNYSRQEVLDFGFDLMRQFGF